jgi:hypothetical protein
MILFFFFHVFASFAASDSSNAWDKSFPRDNTFCSIGKEKVEISLRGSQKTIEPKERGYGDLIFYTIPNKEPMLLELNKNKSDTYRFLLGKETACSKSHGHVLDSSTFAVLLLKENKPFKDLLVIHKFDLKTLSPKGFIETNFPTDLAIKTTSGFAFRTTSVTEQTEVGQINIGEDRYIYQEKNLPIWINYTDKGFEIDPELTFSHFPWKEIINDKKEFFSLLGWNPKEKKFSNEKIYMAVNHKLKKNCLLISEIKQKISGTENWRCLLSKSSVDGE